MIGVRKRRDEVLATNLRRIHFQCAREQVDRALTQVGRLRAAGASVGIGRNLVG